MMAGRFRPGRHDPLVCGECLRPRSAHAFADAEGLRCESAALHQGARVFVSDLRHPDHGRLGEVTATRVSGRAPQVLLELDGGDSIYWIDERRVERLPYK